MTPPLSYADFLDARLHVGADHGFDPVWMPSQLFPFQVALVEWAVRKGRAAIFADCGLGKTPMQLTWAENVARHTGKRVLILTPLAVAFQTVREGAKFGVEVTHRREGIEAGDRIVVTNYERLHHFRPEDFAGVVCDESSILKCFDGETRKAINDFLRKREYRLLCTATAAPNDYIELGSSSEALGDLGWRDMTSRFFKQDDNSAAISSRSVGSSDGRITMGTFGKYRLRHHAERDFWRWVCSWARAVRRPSDLGFENGDFILPRLDVRQHVVSATKPRNGYLFDIPAVGLTEQRQDLRNTIAERCAQAADLINAHDRPAVAWCNLNDEGTMLERTIKGAVEVAGNDTEEHKEESFRAFADGKVRVIVSKPTIAGFGLNWQHCAHQTFFPSHSYEQYYQCTRRCWRFGQRNPVTVDMVTTDGQENVLSNLTRKSEQADAMFNNLVAFMRHELRIVRHNEYTKAAIMPSWMKGR